MTTSTRTTRKATDRMTRKPSLRKRGEKATSYKLTAKDRRAKSKIRWASF